MVSCSDLTLVSSAAFGTGAAPARRLHASAADKNLARSNRFLMLAIQPQRADVAEAGDEGTWRAAAAGAGAPVDLRRGRRGDLWRLRVRHKQTPSAAEIPRPTPRRPRRGSSPVCAGDRPAGA